MGFIAGCFVGGFVMLLAVSFCYGSGQADDDAAEIMWLEQDELIERSLDYEDDESEVKLSHKRPFKPSGCPPD